MKSTNKPAIRFKGYNDAWEQRKLGGIAELLTGFPFESEKFTSHGIKLVRGMNVKRGYLDFSDDLCEYWCSAKGLENYLLKNGDILIQMDGALIGKSYAKIQENQLPALLVQRVTRIRVHSFIANEAFVYQQIQKDFLNYIKGTKTETAVPHLSLNDIANFLTTIPSIEEQKKIGVFFERIDHLITLHQRECTKLINIKNITLTKMIKSIPDLKFPKFTNVWEQRKLGELAKRIYGGGTPATMNELFWNGNIPWIQSSDIIDGKLFGVKPRKSITQEGLINSATQLVPKNSIAIITRVGVGKLAFIPFSYTTSQDFVSLSVLNTEPYFTVYACYKKLQSELYAVQGTSIKGITKNELLAKSIMVPKYNEQRKIGIIFKQIDNLITLHQRECKNQNGRCHMLSEVVTTDLFCDYYIQWVKVYKEGAVRKVTLDKYMMTYSWLLKLASHLRLCDITRVTYQQILNDYAITHEKQTTMDFHHQLKGAIADAVDDGLITKDPTRKAIIKGKTPTPKKIKYLNQYELHTLLSNLQLKDEINWDWLILLVAKTGMRFSEALAITPSDFDFAHQMLSISKTWNYKGNGGFLPTKNKSSVRKIQLDWQTVIQFSELVKRLPPEKPIFITKERVYNSTVNDVLARHCTKNNIPVISIHGLRHTHASLLLFAGVSIASVARRLGHSSMTTTQKTYLHIIQELENKDIDLVMRSLSGLS
mgnify:CR=1 FL=1